jgi:hypothetical protein
LIFTGLICTETEISVSALENFKSSNSTLKNVAITTYMLGINAAKCIETTISDQLPTVTNMHDGAIQFNSKSAIHVSL